VADFQRAHRQWVEEALSGAMAGRNNRWSEAIAVGSLAFVDKVRSDLGYKAKHREVEQVDGRYVLREQSEAYERKFGIENDALMTDNTIPWEINAVR
jgi:putative transposase